MLSGWKTELVRMEDSTVWISRKHAFGGIKASPRVMCGFRIAVEDRLLYVRVKPVRLSMETPILAIWVMKTSIGRGKDLQIPVDFPGIKSKCRWRFFPARV